MKKFYNYNRFKAACLFYVIVFLCATIHAPAQVMSDEGLYANGQLNYEKNNWHYAAIYLFSFIQRNPNVIKNDAVFKKEVVEAFDHCMTSLNRQVVDLEKCNEKVVAFESKNNNGATSVTQGLGTTPPPLRKPSKVRFAATVFQQQQAKRYPTDTTKPQKVKVQAVVH